MNTCKIYIYKPQFRYTLTQLQLYILISGGHSISTQGLRTYKGGKRAWSLEFGSDKIIKVTHGASTPPP